MKIQKLVRRHSNTRQFKFVDLDSCEKVKLAEVEVKETKCRQIIDQKHTFLNRGEYEVIRRFNAIVISNN